MEDLIENFRKIDSEIKLRGFLQRNGFRVADSRSHPDQFVLGVFIGEVQGRRARVTHRLYDVREAAQSPERNRIMLEIDGLPTVEAGFAGNY